MSSARKPVPACTVAVTASIRPDGDTSRVRLTAAYVTALENAGLIPLIVPPLSSEKAAVSVLDSVSGLVLTGGEDVDPALYGENRHEKVRSVNPARDATEAALIRAARGRGRKTPLSIARSRAPFHLHRRKNRRGEKQATPMAMRETACLDRR